MSRAVLMLLACCFAYSQTVDQPLSFEVASVKPSPPPERTGGMRMGCSGGPGTPSPGQYTCSNATLAMMVQQAYGLKPFQLPSASADAARFDIAAKIPVGVTTDQVRSMFQNLLVERFKLAYHYEKKEMQVYDLVVGKSGLKMKESPPEPPPPADAAPPGAPPPPPGRMTIGPDGLPVFPVRRGMTSMMMGRDGLRRITTTDATMERIVSTLSGQLGRPVTDATGLKGKYDFTLTFAGDAAGAGGGANMSAAAPDGSMPSAPETDAPPILAAVQEQLGLKLEPKKGAVDVFVIDHVEKTPTEN
jgi:uncharacterized protein (TIGR03435 family)